MTALSPDEMPKELRDCVIKARRAWLRNTEVEKILTTYKELQVRRDTLCVSHKRACLNLWYPCSCCAPPAHSFITNPHDTSTQLSDGAPKHPASGSLYLFNRRLVRFFRKDGYTWKKKSDNKTVKEVERHTTSVTALHAFTGP